MTKALAASALESPTRMPEIMKLAVAVRFQWQRNECYQKNKGMVL